MIDLEDGDENINNDNDYCNDYSNNDDDDNDSDNSDDDDDDDDDDESSCREAPSINQTESRLGEKNPAVVPNLSFSPCVDFFLKIF